MAEHFTEVFHGSVCCCGLNLLHFFIGVGMHDTRWLNISRRSFTVQYAVVVSIFFIFFIGVGMHDTRKDLGTDVSYVKYKLQTNREDGNKFSYNIDNRSLALNIPNEIYEKERYIMNNGDPCNTLPAITDLIFDKIYWQKYKFSNGKSLYMYSAYYDHREIFGNISFVRINGLMNTQRKTKPFMCKLWFKTGNEKVAFSNIYYKEIFDKSPNKGIWGTIIATCEIPPEKYGEVPFAVSVVECRCEKTTNLLRVDYLQPENNIKKNFAVCVKGLDFPSYDISIQLVEWFELLFILGVDKVYLYKFNLHPNISKVFQYYENKGKIDVIPINLPGDQPSDPQRVHEFIHKNGKEKNRQEKILYQDCFYKNIYKYRYIGVFDPDEVIIPRKVKSWIEFFDTLEKEIKSTNTTRPGAYLFNRTISLDSMRQSHGYASEIPKYMYMLQNVYRSPLYENNPKAILDTELIVGINNHVPILCAEECAFYNVPTYEAHTIHFRGSCRKHRERFCKVNTAIKDPVMWRYKDQLVQRTTSILKTLQLIS